MKNTDALGLEEKQEYDFNYYSAGLRAEAEMIKAEQALIAADEILEEFGGSDKCLSLSNEVFKERNEIRQDAREQP